LNNPKKIQIGDTAQPPQVSGEKGLFKKAPCLTRPARARQDVLFLWQGRSMACRVPDGSTFVAKRRVHGVREHDNGPTCLRACAVKRFSA